jgi:hypothetical protein
MKKILTLALLLIASITLVACGETTDGEMSDADKVEEARASLLLGGLDQVKANMNLPTAGRNGTTISWESSDPSVISNTGEVTRPAEGEGNVEVTLTATITLNDESATREFVAVVIQEEPSNTFDSIATLHETSAKNDVVEFQGIVSSVFNGGYFLTDGTDVIGIYGQLAEEVNVGDEIYVKGSYASYYTLFQISDVTVEDILSSGNPVDLDVTNTTIPGILAEDSSDKLIHGKHYNIIGTVELRGEYNNVWLYTGDEAVVIYYESPADSIAALEAVVGETIAIDVVYYTDHPVDGLRVVFQGGASDITLQEDFSDEQNARLAASSLTIGALETTSDFDLPSSIEGFDASVTWSTSDASVVAADGTVSRDEEIDYEATLTATITVGSESYMMDFPVTVLSYATEAATPVAVADVLAGTVGEEYLVEGVVSALNMEYGFFIQDLDGTAIYVASTFEGVEVGDHVVLRGDLGLWDSYGNYQLKLEDASLVEDNDGDNDVLIITDQTATEIVDAFQADYSPSSKIYTADLTFSHVDTYGYAFFDAGTAGDMRITFKYEDYAPELADAEEGLVLEDVTFVVYDVNFNNLRVVSVEILEEAVSVADVLAGTVGENYYVTGVVSAVNLSYGFFIQDADGTAIYVKGSQPGVEEGDMVELTGDLAIWDQYGNSQLSLENVVLKDNYKGNEDIFIITDQTAVEIVDAFQADYSPSGKLYTADLTFTHVDTYGYAFFDAGTAEDMQITFKYEDYAPFLETAEAGLVLENVTFVVYDVNFNNLRVVSVILDETAHYAHLVVNDTVVTVTGVVTFVQNYDGSFFVEDADGTTIYVDDFSNSLDAWPTVDVGDEVTVVGNKGFYRVPLVDTVSAITVNSSGNALTNTVHEVADLGAFRDAPNSMNFGQEFLFTDVTVVEVRDGEIVFYINGENHEMLIDLDESVDLTSLGIETGDVITFTATLYRAYDWYDDVDATYYFGVTDVADVTVAE